MATQTVLDAVRAAPTLLEAIRAADALTIAAVSDGGGRAVRLLTRAALDPADQLTAIAAVHSLAQVFDEEADLALLRLLADERAFIREHAAWAFGGRLPRPAAVGPLLRMVRDGGFAGMLAQRTLLLWASSTPDLVALALEGALIGERDRYVRARYVETIGLVPGAIAERTLLHTAADEGEVFEARAAAADALGERPSDDAALMLARLGEMPEPLGPVARVALADRAIAPVADAGPTVAQLFVHADIDGTLTRVGAGDNGGIATLLVRLGDALTEEDCIERVLTLSRGTWAEAERALAELPAAGHGFAPVPFVGAAVPMPLAWPRRIAAERGIRRYLRAAGRVDVVHLRMADVGSLAAAAVARELEIPVVFTVAPDPHALIAGLDEAGTLSRADFGERDAVEHFWFRVRLVQRLAADAAHTVLFPRAELAETMRDMLGIDITAHPERHTIVPEGIDVRLVERGEEAARDAAAGEPIALDAGDDLSALDALLAELPAERRGLPLLLSVGRLHRVKGMATLAEAWAGSPLRDRANLLLVGGDLDAPTPDETEQLDRIRAVAARPGSAGGLLLAGHRPNGTVARWLGAVRHGRPGLAAAGGAYVCASVKEEFGIALLEALAAGLPVVAPATGGPATYVEEGVTGFLVDTSDQEALAVAACLALDLAAGPLAEYSAERGRAMVRERYTIEAMAHALSAVYARATAEQERPLGSDLVLGAS
ncbi:glycosyltransferase involved in cell wall biosynthesis [Rathayibacter sp. PhB93]|uniref:glycosyltransferase n=1 Tax=unclassified Rathayibacter TaxID=2609250 RepID=UPI000F47174A|nr:MULTISPECIES: glycosyltransferase [unclassified Rathayibacter]ROQ00919.1 glycosyltransferase involved in cell wall biosynthesis [Rathayibacter sp. PhB93]TDQ07273.1 glycosyltransferase involved in cell wall biosynthesis [Rathayibacter sp. PhB1]